MTSAVVVAVGVAAVAAVAAAVAAPAAASTEEIRVKDKADKAPPGEVIAATEADLIKTFAFNLIFVFGYCF